jgi:hypothetical protein
MPKEKWQREASTGWSLHRFWVHAKKTKHSSENQVTGMWFSKIC